MARVTAIRAGRSQGKRVNVFLDGRFAFGLEAKVALSEDLWVGQELSDSQVEVLTRSDRFQRCLNAELLGFIRIECSFLMPTKD